MEILPKDDRLDRFLMDYLSVLNSYILAFIRTHPEIGTLVSGGKALNTMLKRKYQVTTLDWDISVWNPEYVDVIGSPLHSEARDQFGTKITNYLNKAIVKEKYRLEPIEKYWKVTVLEITYEIASYPFKHYSGFLYRVGHINISTSLGKEGIIDVVPLPRKEVPTTYAGINFLSLDDIVEDLTSLATLIPSKKDKYEQRLNRIEVARKNGGLSCNYYRYVLTHNYEKEETQEADDELRKCVKETIFGSLDPLYPRLLRMIPKRYIINRQDILNSYSYIYSLDKEARNIIRDYTSSKSSTWNLTLFHNALYPNEKVPEDPEINILKRIIDSAPPLEFDLQVYRISRYFFYFDKSNEQLKEGIVQYQATFISSSFDNELNISPFVDLFGICCCYVIKIPKGSRVLILGETSKFSSENEVLISPGCGLKIEDKGIRLVTSTPGAVFYNETTTYTCRYIEPSEMKKLGSSKCLGHDCLPDSNSDPKLWDKILKYQQS